MATLSREDLERIDPGRPQRVETAYLCPFQGCEGKRRRTLYVNTITGLWNCQRCGERGRLVEFWEDSGARRERQRRHRRATIDAAYDIDPVTKILGGLGGLHDKLNALHTYGESVDSIPLTDAGSWGSHHAKAAWIRGERTRVKKAQADLVFPIIKECG